MKCWFLSLSGPTWLQGQGLLQEIPLNKRLTPLPFLFLSLSTGGLLGGRRVFGWVPTVFLSSQGWVGHLAAIRAHLLLFMTSLAETPATPGWVHSAHNNRCQLDRSSYFHKSSLSFHSICSGIFPGAHKKPCGHLTDSFLEREVCSPHQRIIRDSWHWAPGPGWSC